jgi:hypothetical protein
MPQASSGNSDEDEACPATQMAMDHMHRTIDVEQGLLEELMSTTPTSVAEMAAMVL